MTFSTIPVKQVTIHSRRSLMEVEDVKVKCILYRILREFDETRIPFAYCSNNNEVIDVIQHNKQYQIILVCSAEHIQELYEMIVSRYIRRIFIFGNYKRLDFPNKEITIVNTNERDLLLDVISCVINYIHDEEMKQRELENHRIADERAMDILQLLEHVQTLYFNRS